jgi:hypothetical protein
MLVKPAPEVPPPSLSVERLHSQAALLRNLLEELETLGPETPEEVRLASREQVVNELVSLGCRLLECAVLMSPRPPVVLRFSSPRARGSG